MLIKSDRPTHDIPPLRDPDQNFNLAYEGTEKSEILNKYFCSISNLDDANKDLPEFDDRCHDFLSQIIVSEQDVLDIVSTLDANKAVGPDIVSNRMLLAVRNEISKPLYKVEARIEEQEQYSRRTSLRFHNVPAPTDDNGDIIKPINTDALVLGICNKNLNLNLNTRDIGRSHPIGEIKDGKIAIIVRFLSYRQRQLVFNSKRNLKGNKKQNFHCRKSHQTQV
ncbi:unnamed protein product [Mytilus coruscus]|uniref:Uncharacterized protein n=1 Tax=Mytilus coruscus TaxID=42192 RepID=A0A6J8AA25_MYTCO|nr:unnamed protein product [Mytilus coruscus]